MTAAVCTCIRHERDARLVAVPDPTCPHGTAQADRDARHTATGLGRLLRWTARAYLAIALPVLYATPIWNGWHWLAAAIAIPAAFTAMPLPKEADR